jgi:hypothetical protein
MECWVDEACAASSPFHHSITQLLHFSRGKHTSSASAKRYRSRTYEQRNCLQALPQFPSGDAPLSTLSITAVAHPQVPILERGACRQGCGSN